MGTPLRDEASEIADALTDDHFLGGAVQVWQSRRGHRAGAEAVMLAAAAPAQEGGRWLDLASGVGVAGFCLSRRTGARVTCLDADPDAIALARRNAERNDLAERVECQVVDAFTPSTDMPRNFDGVIVNPPFFDDESAIRPPSRDKRTAHVSAHSLADWIDTSVQFAKPKGRVVLIHRMDRLPDILAALEGRAGQTVAAPLWPKLGRAANRVIVTARAGLKGSFALAPGLVLHEHRDKGRAPYTPVAEEILLRAQPFPWNAPLVPHKS